MGEKVDVPALRAEMREVGDRRLAAGQDDEIADRQRLARTHEDEPHVRLHAQRIEVVEIGDAREHRHGDRDGSSPAARRPELQSRPRLKASSAGRRAASAKNGTSPRPRQPVCRFERRHAARNRLASPRNLLTIKPTIIAASSGASAAFVPTICANDRRRGRCRRSARPGQSAARAKPILAMSPWRRLISAALPAPSTSTRSASAFMRAKLSSTAAISFGLSA